MILLLSININYKRKTNKLITVITTMVVTQAATTIDDRYIWLDLRSPIRGFGQNCTIVHDMYRSTTVMQISDGCRFYPTVWLKLERGTF